MPLRTPLPGLVIGSVVAAVLCLGASRAHGQDPAADTVLSFTFRGNVVDHVTEAPIEGAFVQIAELGRSAEADANGYFEFRDFVPDRYTIITASFGHFESLRMVRMYTNDFLQRGAERGFELQPINITTGRGC